MRRRVEARDAPIAGDREYPQLSGPDLLGVFATARDGDIHLVAHERRQQLTATVVRDVSDLVRIDPDSLGQLRRHQMVGPAANGQPIRVRPPRRDQFPDGAYGAPAGTMTASCSSMSRAIGVASVTRAVDLSVTVAPITPSPIIISKSELPVSCRSLVRASAPPAPLRLKTYAAGGEGDGACDGGGGAARPAGLGQGQRRPDRMV